jgi:hypothetical protein
MLGRAQANSMTAPENTRTIAPYLHGLYKELVHDVTSVSLKWKTALQLFAVSEERIKLLNRTASGFFLVCQTTFRDDVFLSLSRLTDPLQSTGKDNLTLSRLTEHLDKMEHAELFEILEKKISLAIDNCKPFREYRHKTLAHTDLEKRLFLYRDPLPEISANQVNEAIQSVQDTLNTFGSYFFNTTTYFEEMIQTGGVDRLVYYLQKGLEAREKELQQKRDAHGLTSGSS